MFNLYVTVDDSAVYKPPPEVPKVGMIMNSNKCRNFSYASVHIYKNFILPQKEEKKKEDKKIAPVARLEKGHFHFCDVHENTSRTKKKVTAVVPPNPERKKWVGIVENQKHVFCKKKILQTTSSTSGKTKTSSRRKTKA